MILGGHLQAFLSITPNGKVAHWNFKGNKPILVLGDSNVNRIPPFHNPNIQVDSYPGATFYNFTKVLEKTEVCLDTGIVVLGGHKQYG